MSCDPRLVIFFFRCSINYRLLIQYSTCLFTEGTNTALRRSEKAFATFSLA